MKKQTASSIQAAICCLGGAGKLAAVLGIRQSTISNWRARGTVPDALLCTAIERATGGAVTRQDLRPDDWQDIWPELAGSAGVRDSSTSGAPLPQVVAAKELGKPLTSKARRTYRTTEEVLSFLHPGFARRVRAALAERANSPAADGAPLLRPEAAEGAGHD